MTSEWEAGWTVLINKATGHIMVTIIIITYSYYQYVEEHQAWPWAPLHYMLCKPCVKRKAPYNPSKNQGLRELYLLISRGGALYRNN